MSDNQQTVGNTLSLLALGGGAVIERMDDEFKKVLENIADPNTDAETARSITAKFTLKPTEDRKMCEVHVEVNTKMVGGKKIATRVFVGMDANGHAIAVEEHPTQLRMDFAALLGPVETPAQIPAEVETPHE